MLVFARFLISYMLNLISTQKTVWHNPWREGR